jgi:hypothetical protein
MVKLPWIPSEADMAATAGSGCDKPIRHRVMLAFAYDAALRREAAVLGAQRRRRPDVSNPATTPISNHTGSGRDNSVPHTLRHQRLLITIQPAVTLGQQHIIGE